MKFRKKPVVIEAVQFDGTKESANQILGWIGSNGADAKRAHSAKPEHGVIISTLEGDMAVSPGDFVIRGVQGEFYPCKPDIFAKTYDAVGDGGKGPGLTGCTCLMCEFHRSAEAIINAEGQGINGAPALRLTVENAMRLRRQIQERQG